MKTRGITVQLFVKNCLAALCKKLHNGFMNQFRPIFYLVRQYL